MNHVHFIGIGGNGLLPLALLAARQHPTVTGWDDRQTHGCSLLQDAGVETQLSLDSLVTPDIVVVSAAISEEHPELKLAR